MEGSILIKSICTNCVNWHTKKGLTKYLHAFTDGRDCDPQSGKGFIQALEKIFMELK